MKPCSVMMIEDDEVDRYLLKRAFNKLNITSHIFEAENGQQALDFLLDYDSNLAKFPDEFPPLIIFLDINMPIMNGFEFLEAFAELRQQTDKYNSSVFTMFTSSEREEDKLKAESYDFVKGYIIKAEFTPDCLKQIIEACQQ